MRLPSSRAWSTTTSSCMLSGRSSLNGIGSKSLTRACAYAIAGNLHPAIVLAPTRLNTADAPTRDRELPMPSERSILDFLPSHQIAALHASQFSRASAGWIRLFILAVFCLSPGEGCRFSNHGFSSPGFCLCISLDFPTMPLIGLAVIFSPWIFSWCGFPKVKILNRPRVVLVLVFAIAQRSTFASAMPMMPAGTGEVGRAARRAGNVLQADRVILHQTRQRRDTLLADFDVWLGWLGTNWRNTLAELIDGRTIDLRPLARPS